MELDLEEEKKKLSLKKSRLEAKEKRLKEKERKVRTRRLIELGGLISKAGIDTLNNNALLGALLELKEQSKEEGSIKKWKDKGAKAFEKEQQKNGEALIISFSAEPSREIKSELKTLGFKWNRFRGEWYGYGNTPDCEEALKETEHKIEKVDPADGSE